MREPTAPAIQTDAAMSSPAQADRKRRGLSLPPRGQSLARLQDLENDVLLPDTLERPAEISAAEALPENTTTVGAVPADTGGEVMPAKTETSPAATTAPPTPQPISHGITESSIAVNTARSTSSANGRQVARRADREPTTRITVDMPDSLHRQISYLSVETRRSIKDLVIEALEAQYFAPSGSDTDTPRT